MKKLLKNIKIHFPGNDLNGKQIDILINNGKVVKLGKSITDKDAKLITSKSLHCFPKLVDMQCSVGEPGMEDKEDLQSLAKAAVAGGFGTVVILPTTKPAIDNKSLVQFINSSASKLPISVIVQGALTKGNDGMELSEMFDMYSSGVKMFSDGKRPIKDVNMMKRALEYTKGFGGTVCSFPMDERINPGGMVNESELNTSLGIKQTPTLAESVMLNRDLYLLEYSDSTMHVSTVSCAASAKLIRDAKKKGGRLTAGVALANLLYSESRLQSFDSNYKTSPPLRSESDRKQLIKDLSSGTIDVVVSDHTPETIENKECEFDQAAFGMTMLETALSLINTELPDLKWDLVAKTMSLNPRAILNIDQPELKVGEAFDFTVFDETIEWTYDEKNCQSKAHNSPVFGKTLKGRVVQI